MRQTHRSESFGEFPICPAGITGRKGYSQKSIGISGQSIGAGKHHRNTFDAVTKHDSEFPICPAGITGRKGYSQNSIRISGQSIGAGKHHRNTFDVVTKHDKLSVKDGVRFNVETVPEALKEHMEKPFLSRQSYLDKICKNGKDYYNTSTAYNEKELETRLEAASCHKEDKLVAVGGNGFLVACVTAFAQHLPLELSPDHIWSLISYAFAKNVDENAEELRENFVQYEGKKRLEVVTPDSFQMSQNNDPDTGASANDWQTYVFPDFSRQIKGYIGESTHSLVAGKFSTTTAVSNAASEIVLMSAMKNYFSYCMRTKCGIPSITLTGTEEDWVSLRTRTEALGKVMQKDFTSYWMPLVLPLLDEFIASYRGSVKNNFWQSMVKLRNNGMGSGSEEFISGWMQIFFPYLASGRLNTSLRPWHEMFFHGPNPDEFPTLISSVPVDWNYFGSNLDLHFHAGITGVSQNTADGMLAPVMGWYVTHAPPKSSAERLEVEDEIAALSKVHKGETSGVGCERLMELSETAKELSLKRDADGVDNCLTRMKCVIS